MHVCGRDVTRRHLLRLQPNTHGERAVAENVGTLHTANGAQFRLHHARQVVRDLILIQILRRKTDVHRRELVIGRLQVNDRRLRFGREVVLYLRHLGLYLRESGVGVVVELEVYLNCANSL